MRGMKFLAATAAGAGLLFGCLPAAEAQITINLGPAPNCPYGYYDAAPYQCAPSGYYGPEWFRGEAFIGAGPWFHGPSGFHGHVNNSYHPQYGYHGSFPNPGERADPARRVSAGNFHGNEERDGRGNVAGERH